MRIWAQCLWVLVVLGSMLSCRRPYHTEDETYYLVATGPANPYWQEVEYGFNAGIRFLGTDVQGEFMAPPEYDVEAQLQLFREAVARKPAGILVSPAQPEPFTEPINQAIEQGIPVICIDSDAPQSKRVTFIGTDNYKAGVQGGELAAKLLEEKGNVVILTIPGQYNLDERVRGYRDALKNYSKIKVLDVLDDQASPQKASELISEFMDQGKERLDAILCMDAAGGEGAADALYRRVLKDRIIILAMDKNPRTLEWIERGGIEATISQKPYTMAYYGVKLLDNLHHNAVRQFMDWRTAPVYPLPTRVDTGTAVVRKDNLAAFKAALPPAPVGR